MGKKTIEVQRTEALLKQVSANMLGSQVNGRQLRQPDSGLYKKLKKKQDSASPERFVSRLSNASGKNKTLVLDDEEKQEVSDFTRTFLMRSGSTGGNKSLFVNSKIALMRQTASPMDMATSSNKFLAMHDPSVTADYKTLKKNVLTTKLIANRSSGMDSSISICRLDREFSPSRLQGSQKENTAAIDKLLKTLQVDHDEEDIKKTLKDETLPGTCKSKFALNFRLQTDQANANFMTVSLVENTQLTNC